MDVRLAEAAPTVVVVEWTTTEPVRGRIEFGDGGALALSTPMEDAAATEHRQILLGLPPLTDARLEIVVDRDGETRSAVYAVTTGGVPAVLPSLTAEGAGAGDAEGFDGGWLAVPVTADDGTATAGVVTLIDSAGRWVWGHALGPGESSLRARRARDGSGLVFNVLSLDKDVEIAPMIRHVTWEGELRAEVPATDIHHDFVELPDGRFAFLGLEPRTVDGRVVPSDVIVEVGADGSEVVWRLWDDFDRFGGVPASADIGEGETLGHANAMQYVEESDAYLVNFALLGAVALIRRDGTGVDWVLGSDTSDFAYDDEGAMRRWRSHDVRMDGDSLLMFVNDTGGEECSQVWRVDLSLDAMSAERSWSYEPECYYNYVLGGVGSLPSGDVLATWSLAGRIDQVTPAGALAWSLQASVGAGFGYSDVLPDLY